MSFQYHQSNPSFSSSQQVFGNNGHWHAARDSRASRLHSGHGTSHSAGIPNKMSSFFDSDRALPMYKDKPYFAPRRTGPRRWRKKALYGAVFVFVVVALWYYGPWSGPWSGFRPRERDTAAIGEELWEWMQSLDEQESISGSWSLRGPSDWAARRERVRDAFIVSWDGYERHAWGFDKYSPIAKTGEQMVEGGMGWIIVDALDTLMMMNLTSRVQHARHWIHNSLQYDQDHDVSTFETTIRMLGGLLSAHYLSTTYPDLAPIKGDDAGSPGEDLYIEKAADLANRLLGAFESKTGIPYASVNLNTSEGIPSHSDNGASSTAEATSVQLEFKYLAKLTGEAEYWQLVEKVMEVVDGQGMQDGLLPIYIYPETGSFKSDNIRLGSRGDSYYEYLIKQYLQTSKQEPVYKDMWDEALMGIRKHLITYTKHSQLTVLGERPNGLAGNLLPKMDHLVCFLPGTIALGATGGQPLSEAKKSPDWTQRQDEEILLAKELMKTCWATYLSTKTRLAPEITYFKVDDTPRKMTDIYPDSTMTTGNHQSRHEDLPLISQSLYPLDDESLRWPEDLDIHLQDRHNLQRPETAESLFYMYRITGDETYRHWGWEMFKSFVNHTAVVEWSDLHDIMPESATSADTKKEKPPRVVGFTSLTNADAVPPVQRDNMESFWLAETLKYFYLLFSEREFISLEEHVFNTEAHPFPRFKLGGDLKTGWSRKEASTSSLQEALEDQTAS